MCTCVRVCVYDSVNARKERKRAMQEDAGRATTVKNALHPRFALGPEREIFSAETLITS